MNPLQSIYRRSGPLAAALALMAMQFSLAGAPTSGVIKSVNTDAGTIVLQRDLGGDEITAQVGRGDIRIWKEGQSIRGDLVPYGPGFRLQSIWPNDPESAGLLEQLNRQMHRNTLQRGSRVFRAVGEPLPRFALYDQNGNTFLSESLRGNYAIINFIFTRCAVPTMCPLSTRKMIETQKLAREAGIDNLHLVSITLDADFDTPGIFKAYAMDYEIDEANFSLLTGPAQALENLKLQLGVLAEDDPEQIIRHTMSTALVDPTGRIIYRLPGSMWSPEVFIQQIAKHSK
jgi:protein SCO1